MASNPEDSKSRPVFGFPKPGQEYKPRPGAYAVILNERMEVAVLQVKSEYFLLGGGIEPGELPEDALQREAVEEFGWSLVVGSLVGESIDYIEVEANGHCYEIQSRFYIAAMKQKVGDAHEKDHNLVWIPAQVAVTRLKRQSQAWIISLFAPQSPG